MENNLEEKDSKWIDVHDDKVMREMGFFRPYDVEPRDPSVWTKTNKERRELKRAKGRCSKLGNWHMGLTPNKEVKLSSKLIVSLKKNNSFDKTTYSFKCRQSNVNNLLDRFVSKSGKSLVAKFNWNGKTYNSSQLPA